MRHVQSVSRVREVPLKEASLLEKQQQVALIADIVDVIATIVGIFKPSDDSENGEE